MIQKTNPQFLMRLFECFSLLMDLFTVGEISLNFIFIVKNNRFKMQMSHLKSPLELLSAHLNK